MSALRDWLNTQLGADAGRAVQMILALIVVILLLVGLAWIFRRFSGHTHVGGRGQRLSVVDAAPVDGRRRLLLLRRDDVEHLVMIGGPNDVLVESRILRGPQTVAARPMPQVVPAAPVVTEPGAPPRAAAPEAAPAPLPPIEEKPSLRSLPGAGALAAAMAGAGSFVRARLGRAEPSPAAPTPDRRFTPPPAAASIDAPLGRPVPPMPSRVEAPVAPARPIEPAAETELRAAPRGAPTPAEAPAIPPMRPQAPAEPAARTEPQPAPAGAPSAAPSLAAATATVAAIEAAFAAPAPHHPEPPVHHPVEPVVHHPAETPAASAVEAADIAGEIERALTGLATRPAAPAAKSSQPAPAAKHAQPAPAAKPSQPAEVDLLTELDLVAAERPHAPDHRDEPPVHPVAPPAPRVEPHFEAPAPAPAAEAPPVAPPVAAPAAAPHAPLDELEEEMARLLAEISGQTKK